MRYDMCMRSIERLEDLTELAWWTFIGGGNAYRADDLSFYEFLDFEN